MSNEGVVDVIPARFASSRFPGKPLAEINGIPMIVHVFQRVIEAVLPSQVLVATDDQRISDRCSDEGVSVVMTPSSCLTGTDRTWRAVENINVEIVVNVQGDEPLVDPATILAVIEAKRENPGCVINAMSRIGDAKSVKNPNVPKVLVDRNGRLLYMSRAVVPYDANVDAKPTYFRQVCVYAFDKLELEAFAQHDGKSRLEEPEDIEILRFIDLGIPVKMVEVQPSSMAVDTPEDIVQVEAILAGRNKH